MYFSIFQLCLSCCDQMKYLKMKIRLRWLKSPHPNIYVIVKIPQDFQGSQPAFFSVASLIRNFDLLPFVYAKLLNAHMTFPNNIRRSMHRHDRQQLTSQNRCLWINRIYIDLDLRSTMRQANMSRIQHVFYRGKKRKNGYFIVTIRI